MNNHFGKGLMAGLHAPYAYSAHHAVNFCSEYKRGFVLGFTNHSGMAVRFFMAGYRLEG